MKKILSLLILAILFVSCDTNNKPVTRPLSPANIKTQVFLIDPTKDTLLAGMRGGYFNIEKGSFPGQTAVEIHIKEVYSPTEIVYAGLTTESNGRLLESGGMIYFNALQDGKQVEPIQPIAVSIPASYINENMQLFKGEEKPDGTVNWIDPLPIDTASTPSLLEKGELLFNGRCANCHSLFKDKTGPALANVEERVNDRDILEAFIRNPAIVTAENSYFLCQKYKYKSLMPSFSFTDQELGMLLDYLKNEANKRPDLRLPSVNDSHWADTIDYSSCIPAPCGFDTTYLDTTTYDFGPAGNMMDMHAEATREDSMDYLYHPPDSLEKLQRSGGLTDMLFTEGRYNFKIKTLGWFNVDAFYEGMKGTEIVDLFVKTDFGEKNALEVHVFFPAKKLLTVGTLHEEDSLFHFEKYKGQIPLFLNDEAIAFAIASKNEKLYYGIASFRVTKHQLINISIKETSRENLQQSFKEMKLDGIDLDIISKKRMLTPRSCGGDSSGNVLNLPK